MANVKTPKVEVNNTGSNPSSKQAADLSVITTEVGQAKRIPAVIKPNTR